VVEHRATSHPAKFNGNTLVVDLHEFSLDSDAFLGEAVSLFPICLLFVNFVDDLLLATELIDLGINISKLVAQVLEQRLSIVGAVHHSGGKHFFLERFKLEVFGLLADKVVAADDFCSPAASSGLLFNGDLGGSFLLLALLDHVLTLSELSAD